MEADRDLSASLPDPPLPRPDRREAAIAEALRRFDGAPPGAPAPRPVPARRRNWRPQIAALASVLLVALVGIPIWLNDSNHYHSVEPTRRMAQNNVVPVARQSTLPAAETARSEARPPAPPQAVARPPAAPMVPPPVAVREVASPVSDAAQDAQLNRLPVMAPAPPPPPPPAPPPQTALAQAKGAFRTASAAQAPAAGTAATASPSEELVVTGVRRSRRSYATASPLVTVDAKAPEDWNLCTLDDPSQDLAHCRSFADPGARGARGRAAAQFADGMTRAWTGDLDAAIAAFDRAIDQSPLPIAYLNRALALQRNGDSRRARADFDSAVRRAPDDPRNYYYRSRFFREQGDARLAQIDANRAIDIDPTYALLPR